MATTGKVRTLTARALQSSDLAFEIPGIIDWQNPAIKIGSRLSAPAVLSWDNLMTMFRKRLADASSDVIYNSSQIASELNSKGLFRLRNGQEVTALDQAIANRNLQYARVYKHSAAVAQLLKQAATAQVEHAKTASTSNKDRHDAIKAAYEAETDPSWAGVRKSTNTVHTSKGKVVNDLFVTPVGMETPKYRIRAFPEGGASIQEPDQSVALPLISDPSVSKWVQLDHAKSSTSKDRPPTFFSQRTVVAEDDNVRLSVNHSNEFWHPKLENSLEFARLQASLTQEDLRSALNALAADSAEEALKIEFGMLESDVLRNQAKLANTYLLPTLRGVVTAIYKDVGEYVQPGEPVLRLENDEKMLLVGVVQVRGVPTIGQGVTVSAKKMFEVSGTKSFAGTVAAVRGHNADDDEWDLVIETSSAADNLPINFSFDARTTTLSFA